MIAANPLPVQAFRLDVSRKPWRLPRESDLRVHLVNVPVSYGADQDGIPYAFAALPARYFVELLAAAGRSSRPRSPLVILNPAVDAPPAALFAVLAEIEDLQFPSVRDGADDVLILCNYADQIIAYVVPEAWTDDALLRELRFLSCTDADLDAALMTALGLRPRLRRIRLPEAAALPPALPTFAGIAAVTRHAAKARLRMLASGNRRTVAVVTHHAGDVLLAAKVIRECAPEIDALVVHESYADVAKAECPDLEVIPVVGPLPARGGVASSAHPLNEEILYFEQVVLPVLPPEAAFVFLRPSRGYIEADFTVAAQLAFTLGQADDVRKFPRGFTLECPDLDMIRAAAPNLPRLQGRRVLLHFDGGWPLKIYPPQWQRQLIRLLRDGGFEVSVFGAVSPDVPSYGFTGLADMDALLRQHDLLIGMDSFPCHYASQHIGMPTLCLFASTRMENLAHAAPDYMAIEQGLSCSPCGARTICPRFGGTACQNFVPPEIVAAIAQCGLEQ